MPEPFSARLLPAFVVTLLFAMMAYLLRGVTTGGALAGAAVSFVLYLSLGLAGFLVLLSVFVLTLAATRLGYARKQRLGTAEPRSGRSASQVCANLLVGTLMAAWFAVSPRLAFLAAATAALAEAAADTVSSEVGQALGRRAYLITTAEPVPPGTDGGVSFPGTLAGVLAALVVAGVAVAVQMIPAVAFGPATAAAMLGMFLDSYLGATLERRGTLNNDAVNFFGTALAGGLSILLLSL